MEHFGLEQTFIAMRNKFRNLKYLTVNVFQQSCVS